MTQLDAEREASNFGFTLETFEVDGIQVWRWRRGIDHDWPEFMSEVDALAWIDHGLRTASLFNP